LLYTGDYNTASSRTTEGLKTELPSTDVLITESTYGADAHPATRKTQEAALLSAIASVVEAGGTCYLLFLPSDAYQKFCWHSHQCHIPKAEHPYM